MVRWVLRLVCLGQCRNPELPACFWSSLNYQDSKKKTKKGRKEKGLRFIFILLVLNIIWCLFLIASRACKKYLSFCLFERVLFLKEVYLGLFFYFLLFILLSFGCLRAGLWVFLSFLFVCFLSKRSVNQMFLSPWFLQNQGLGSAALQPMPCPELYYFKWELSWRQCIFGPKKNLEKEAVTSDMTATIS